MKTRRFHLSLLAGTATFVLSTGPAPAAEAINPTFSDVESRGSADATYATNAFLVIHQGRGPVNEPDSSWMPVRGLVYRIAIERDVFFNSLGRRDLADQFLRRRAYGRAIKWTGYVCAVTGLFVALWGLGWDHHGFALVGAGVAVGGAVAREVGEDLMEPVFPEDQAIDMAHRYNEALRARLRLPPSEDAPRKPTLTKGDALELGVVPFISQRSAGLLLGAVF